jgi:Zn-dependent protease
MSDLFGSQQQEQPHEQQPAPPPQHPAPFQHQDPYAMRQYEPIQPRSGLRHLGRKIAGPFVALGALLAKFKFVIVALFKLKFVGTALSMAASIAFYALAFGWWWAVGFVVLIFIHEMGHALELRRLGVPFSAPLFIPFVGAVIGMKQLPDDAWQEARVGLAGPVLGSAGAAVAWALGEAFNSNLLRAVAYVGFFLNLFNLLPFLPLDGGRAAAALHPAVWGVGLLAVLGLVIVRPNPILILILAIGGMEVYRRWSGRGSPQYASYYKVTAGQRATIAAVYFGLAGFLGLAMYELRNIPH